MSVCLRQTVSLGVQKVAVRMLSLLFHRNPAQVWPALRVLLHTHIDFLGLHLTSE